VDDEPANLLALESTLAGPQRRIIRASSGAEALRQVLNHDFAVILLDVLMPGTNGIETAEAIRERERSRQIPIIFLTGLVQTEEMMFKGYGTGAVDYLIKPIRTEVLRAKVAVFVDLALAQQQLKRLNLELEEKNHILEDRSARLQETVAELEAYSYSISHDMRAPLRAMQGYSDILMEECLPLLDARHQLYLKKIASASQRMDRLIQDVLSYSVTARGTFPLEHVETDRLAREIIEQYPNFRASGAQITIEGPLLPVWGNLATMTQCFSNLLNNAIKFMPPGVVPQIRISSEPTAKGVRIWIEDNGIGIPPADAERIFSIFSRLHPTEKFEGTGIGLSIVRKAVEKMGGKVGVIAGEKGGSRFWLELAASTQGPNEPAESRPALLKFQ
jgi:two-component system sensor histidine kinase/response regulator